MLGSHLSIAGGLVNALHEARRLRMECVQVFTRNQRQWAAPPLRGEETRTWRDELHRMGWDDPAEFRVISHNSYLINVASPNAELWERSVRTQRDELDRCEALGIAGCVMHPGAHLGTAAPRQAIGAPPRGTPTKDEVAGMRRIVRAIDRLHRELRGHRTLTLLETTAGAGTTLGYSFEQLAWIRAHVKEPERVGFCLDTCHVLVAGYDMTTATAAAATWSHWDAVCGRASLRAMHLNDSVGPLGSRLDRHAHVGDGHCGRACFAAIMGDPQLERVPMILETPKGDDPKGTPWDRVNMRRLRRLRGIKPNTRSATGTRTAGAGDGAKSTASRLPRGG